MNWENKLRPMNILELMEAGGIGHFVAAPNVYKNGKDTNTKPLLNTDSPVYASIVHAAMNVVTAYDASATPAHLLAFNYDASKHQKLAVEALKSAIYHCCDMNRHPSVPKPGFFYVPNGHTVFGLLKENPIGKDEFDALVNKEISQFVEVAKGVGQKNVPQVS